MNNVFSTYHPIINFGFFCCVIGIGIFLMHPVFLAIGMSAALIYSLMTGGRGSLKFCLCFLLPMIILISVINPLVNHHGMTILFYTKNSYITLEALIYGIASGVMLASVLLWFSCCNKIMTTDKFIYLFGRVIPALSLILSMVMRFVPNYKMQLAKISDAQKCIGRDALSGSMAKKARHGSKIISVMFTWALENAVDTADSMRSRGYGIKGRTTFSIYHFDRRDAFAGVFIFASAAVVLIGAAFGRCSIEFYPYIAAADIDVFSLIVYIAYFMMCYFPIAAEVKEALTWRFLQSKI